MIIREFNSFLVKACRRIPNKKLKSRIYHEMHEHMEDMLDDYLEAGEEREAAIEKVVKDMGNPAIINKQLRRAHRLEIFLARALEATVWILLISLHYTVPAISTYRYSNTKEELETAITQREEPYKYCGEIERNGRVYILYTCETPDENSVKYFESVRLFGKFNIHDKFAGVGNGDGDGNILITLGFANKKSEIETKVYFGFKPTKAKYFKTGFIKREDCTDDDKPNSIISDFYVVPKHGEFIVIDAPEGYRFSGFYYAYDENKQIIEATNDNFSIGRSSRFTSRDYFGDGGYESSYAKITVDK